MLLLRRRRRRELRVLEEAEVYARSYGERSDDVTNVTPVPPDEGARKHGRKLTDRMLRDAFARRLDRRDSS